MTNPRFLPSASLLLVIAACIPDFPLAVPSTLESLSTLMSNWNGESAAAEPASDGARGELGDEPAADDDRRD